MLIRLLSDLALGVATVASVSGDGGSDFVEESPASESVGEASYLSERILLVAFCATCHGQVMRKFDLEGIELVIQPWVHRHFQSGHAVTSIEIEDPRVEQYY